MTDKYIIVNGKFLPEEKAFIHVSDLSVQRGYGIFDFFKIINNKPVFFEDHLQRFFNSAAHVRLNPGFEADEFKELILELHKKNGGDNAGIRITLTGGYSPDGYNPGKPNLIITHSPLNVNFMLHANPISIITYAHQRQMPAIKTIDYLMSVWLQPFIKENNAQDVLYRNGQLIRECPRANFFMVDKKGHIITPHSEILKGITRNKIIETAGKYFQIEERDINLRELYEAEEVFITSSTKNILPVNKIDGKTISSGTTGPVTTKLRTMLNELVF